MDTILYLGLSNAVLAACLALLAAPITRVWRRPTLAHALWLLVLLRLLAPPLLSVTIPRPHWLESAPAPVEADGPEPTVLPDVSAANHREAPDAVVHAVDPGPEVEETATPAPASISITWQTVLLSVWLLGSLAWWLMVARRLYCFQRLLRPAEPAPPLLQEQARRLAGLLGLRRCPDVYLVPAPISPMLLALGWRPRLLLPAALWGRLSPAQQDALLAHELAHLRRGDPWVRRLELVVLGLYWWLPVVWWARHALEEAEEQCCDAWVVWALPDSGPDYAAALVETLTFLSPDPSPVPLGASGAGRVPLLKRRLTMILRGDSPRSLSRRAFWALVVVAAVLLSLAPRSAHTEPPPDEPQPVREEPAPAAESPDRQTARLPRHMDLAFPLLKAMGKTEMLCSSCHGTGQPVAQKDEQTDDWRKAHAEIVRLVTEMQRTQAELRKAEGNLNRILERQAGHSERRKVPPPLPKIADTQKQKLDRLERLEQGLDKLIREVESLRRELRPSAPPPAKKEGAHKQAEKDFQVAEYYRRTGQLASAVYYYQLVCRRYPSSPFAGRASARLQEM